MQRRHFLVSAVLSLFAAQRVKGAATGKAQPGSAKLPVLFIGHGSPMNAIQNNDFTRHLSQLGKTLPRPRAILMISAHWVTDGSRVSAHPKPATIHDFGGFPQTLFNMQYPSPGQPMLASQVASLLGRMNIREDADRGLDHGTWTVLHHLYPKADIPVVQLSLNGHLSLREHLELASGLKALRTQGILIIGSGNVVHNLPLTDERSRAGPYDWAQEFDEHIKQALLQRDHGGLLAQDRRHHRLWRMAHPTLEHYLPLLYTVGAANQQEAVVFPYEGFQERSLSMRSVRIG
ncbi:4,5-DOPA dioxygenase extradiol [Chitinivorax sp. B]|uniref:4,5-DOPA-extradiol-dioxygenase n=1 Tax=Chitinivorax sp. B TaxID=2502235 RepID=UPI0010F77CAB|nr:4,5-DOPA dioxygenase extradiol [Chitinivorax sp. B]